MAEGVVIRGLVKEYPAPGGGRLRAVDGLDLTAEPGEVLAFLGPNGAGKSTTIKVCCGLVQPDAGEVRVAGYSPVTQRAPALRHLGAVLEGNRNVYWDLTVEENLRRTLPLTHGIEAIRAITVHGKSLADTAPLLGGMAVNSAVYLVLGIAVFVAADRRARRLGAVGGY